MIYPFCNLESPSAIKYALSELHVARCWPLPAGVGEWERVTPWSTRSGWTTPAVQQETPSPPLVRSKRAVHCSAWTQCCEDSGYAPQQGGGLHIIFKLWYASETRTVYFRKIIGKIILICSLATKGFWYDKYLKVLTYFSKQVTNLSPFLSHDLEPHGTSAVQFRHVSLAPLSKMGSKVNTAQNPLAATPTNANGV